MCGNFQTFRNQNNFLQTELRLTEIKIFAKNKLRVHYLRNTKYFDF